MPVAPVTFPEFLAYIEREVEVGVALDGDLVIGVDIEIDSVVMLEVIVAIEDLGAMLPADLFLTAHTFHDVYGAYCAAFVAEPGDGGLDPIEGAA